MEELISEGDKLISKDNFAIIVPKQYKLDLEKIFESKDANKKLDLLFNILTETRLTIQGWAIRDESLKEFLKEI
jgi:hypothetical protein